MPRDLNLAETCAAHKTTLLHVSTDYVFDGTNTQPYLETDSTNPINVYGASKRKGEEAIINHCEQYFIVQLLDILIVQNSFYV